MYPFIYGNHSEPASSQAGDHNHWFRRSRRLVMLLLASVTIVMGLVIHPLEPRRAHASCALPSGRELVDLPWYNSDQNSGWITRIEIDFACGDNITCPVGGECSKPYTGYRIQLHSRTTSGEYNWYWTNAAYNESVLNASYQFHGGRVNLWTRIVRGGTRDGQLELILHRLHNNGSLLQEHHEYFSRISPGFVKLFNEAWQRAERERLFPGRAVNDLHFWNDVIIQDYRTSASQREGAIIWGGPRTNAQPHYIGGGTWEAYKRAFWTYGVWLGYPINTEHNWGRVRIQDFRRGTYGDGAIIGGSRAEIVVGNHWKAYIKVDGSNRLRNPMSFIVERYRDGQRWRVQTFEGGELWERSGAVWVRYHNTDEMVRIV